MSDSGQPHRRQPTRLPVPGISPGKNTGVGCHFLLQCIKVKNESEAVQSCPTLSDPMDCCLPGSSVHGIFQASVLEWVAMSFSEINKRPILTRWGRCASQHGQQTQPLAFHVAPFHYPLKPGIQEHQCSGSIIRRMDERSTLY